MPRNRLAIDTANALFNSIFYYHNEKKTLSSKHVRPIWFYATDAKPTKISQPQIDLNSYSDDNEEMPSMSINYEDSNDHSFGSSLGQYQSIFLYVMKMRLSAQLSL